MNAIGHDDAAAAMQPRPARTRFALVLVAVLLFSMFAALGTWQVQRLAWKLDLIERVEQRVRAPAVAAPGPERWPQVNAADDEYRHVQATGRFVDHADTLVQASTERGAGFWLLTPLRLADGSVVLVNRGFLTPSAGKPVADTPTSVTTVTGLLRLTEPRGGFLRRNDAAADRWYSRDVQAIAAARGLDRVAPYFIDADAAPSASASSARQPIGGLTVVAFHNNHLVYAVTWYTLALMAGWAAWRVFREGRSAGEERVAPHR